MKSIVYLIILFFLLVFAINVFAASFTASVNPNVINASKPNQLLNFTISNPSVPIVNVDITLPTNFGFIEGSFGTTAVGSCTNNATTVSWSNATSPLIGIGGTQYFWFNVSVPDVTGNQLFVVSTNDTGANINSTNVYVMVNDVTPPRWSSNSTSPSSPATYSPGGNYGFQINWADNIGVDVVVFETNLNTSLKNFTVSRYSGSSTSGVYVINFTDIPVGTYQYRWIANDSTGNTNATSTLTFNITKSTNPLNLYLDGKLNQNVTVINGTTFTINATSACGQSACKINITKDGIISIATNCEPYCNTTDTLYLGATNTHSYSVTAIGNANYTDNSTGTTYYATVIYPPPRYSISTSIPSSYSSALAIFNVTWTDDNDPNGFNVSLIEIGSGGSATNYTMFRFPGTNVSSYNKTFDAGTYYWKAYANNSYNSWNSTPKTEFTISKATPTLDLTVTPSWDVSRGTETIVSCDSEQVSVNLYRNESSVSNPDRQTLAAGTYVYKCNNTETANYRSVSVSKTLTVRIYTIDFIFTKAENLTIVKQNSLNSTIVEIKNTGELSQNISFTIEDINSTWYSINATNVSLASGKSASFLVDFSVGNVEIKDYTGRFKAYSPNKTITSNFTLRVLPAKEKEVEINSTLANYTEEMLKLEKEINQTKAQGLNVSLAEEKLNQLKTKIEQGENYTAKGDYFNAYLILKEIETLINDTKNELNKVKQIIKEEERKSLIIYVVIGVCIVLIIILAYLFWPTKAKLAVKPEVSREQIWFRLKRKWEELGKKKYRYKES
jgi:hypothetical protein